MSTSAIARVAVQSSSLASIGHRAEDNVLVIEFRNGSLYRYLDVPADAYEELLRAESKGTHFNRFVRTRFAHERITLRNAEN
jgi:KTSC domain-containing protein